MVVNNAVYVGGRRTGPCPLEETPRACREREGFVWVSLYEPTREELGPVTCGFGLHELAVEDALEAHQRPKAERYGDTFFVVKSARYVEETDTAVFGEPYAFAGRDFIVTVGHGEVPDLEDLRRRRRSSRSFAG